MVVKIAPEVKLKRLARIYETRTIKDRLVTSTHARINLEGAIEDIERTGRCDRVSLATIKQSFRPLDARLDLGVRCGALFVRLGAGVRA